MRKSQIVGVGEDFHIFVGVPMSRNCDLIWNRPSAFISE